MLRDDQSSHCLLSSVVALAQNLRHVHERPSFWMQGVTSRIGENIVPMIPEYPLRLCSLFVLSVTLIVHFC